MSATALLLASSLHLIIVLVITFFPSFRSEYTVAIWCLPAEDIRRRHIHHHSGGYRSQMHPCSATQASHRSMYPVYLGSEGALGLGDHDGLVDNNSLIVLNLDRCSLTDGKAGDNGFV